MMIHFFLFTLLFFVQFWTESIPLIENVKIKGSNNAGNMIIVTPNKEFKNLYFSQDFFVKYGDPLDLASLDESQLIVPFIGSVIHLIWVSGQTYSVKTLDKDFYYSLEKIKEVFKIFYPETNWSGQLMVEELVDNKNKTLFDPKRVGVFFSGGLDSITTSFSHLDKKQLLITIKGRDVKLSQDSMWKNVKNQCVEFAKTYGHINTFLASNFHAGINHEFLRKQFPTMPYWGDTSQSLAFAGLSLPILLCNKIPIIYMGSTNTIECPLPDGSHPLIDNNIQMSGIQFHYDRPDLTRIEKLNTIAKMSKKKSLIKPLLRVCWGNDEKGGNCCSCKKCIALMTQIIALGENLSDYGFYQNVNQLECNTQKYFSPSKKRFLKFEDIEDWKSTQNKIREILNNPNSTIVYDQEIKNYLTWFITIPFDNYCWDNKVKFEEDKEFYTPLWAISEKGPIDLEIIKSFSSKGTQ